MNNFVLALILILFAIGGVVVRKTYYAIPLKELKRRALAGDSWAVKIYPSASYSRTLRSLLWLYIALLGAGGIVLLSRDAPIWLSLIAVVALIWVAYSWLPSSRTSGAGRWLTSFVNPLVFWLLSHLHPILDRGASRVEKRYTAEAHTGMYERDDLIDLIEQQQRQHDSRFSDGELELAKRALSFDNYEVHNLLIPEKAVKSVMADDTVGPVFIDELHKAKQDYVLVRETTKGEFVGTLDYRRLGLHSSGKVKDYMESSVYFMHEDDSLAEVLKAFFATNHPMFVVVNNAAEFVGIVTIEAVLKQLLGHLPDDGFEGYGSPAAVVNRYKQARKLQEQEVIFDEPKEVVAEDAPDDEASEISDSGLEQEAGDEPIIQDSDLVDEDKPPEKIERIIDEEIDMAEEDDDKQESKSHKK